MSKYTIHHYEDDPYGDIIIKRGFSTVIKFPLDDAPVHDYNKSQRLLANKVLSFLISCEEEPVDNNMAGDLDAADIEADAWANPDVPITLLEKVMDEIWQEASDTMSNPQKAHFVGERLKEMTPLELLAYISSAIE